MLSKPIPLLTVYNVLVNLYMTCTRCQSRNDLLFVEFAHTDSRVYPVCRKCGEKLFVAGRTTDRDGHILKKVCLSLLQDYYTKNAGLFNEGAQSN